MIDWFDYFKNLKEHRFYGMTDDNEVSFYARIINTSDSEYIKRFFDGTERYDQVENVTPGKVYHIFKVEGFGDVSDWFFINDIGEEDSLAEFFFEKVEDEDVKESK